MKRYTLSLTITDEDNNQQFTQLRAPHLTGKQVHDLIDLTTAGILYEPAIEMAQRPAKQRQPRKIVPPIEPLNGPTVEDLEGL